MVPKSLDSLTDDCLLVLLQLLPLKLKIKLRAVCKRWKGLIEQQILSKVVSIYIEADGGYSVFVRDRISNVFIDSVRRLNSKQILCLLKHFTGLDTLNLNLDQENSIEIPILELFAGHLKHLILEKVSGTGDNATSFTRTFFAVGEKMLNLESFKMKIVACRKNYLLDLLTKLATLPKLTTLHFDEINWKQLYSLDDKSVPSLTSVKYLTMHQVIIGPQFKPSSKYNEEVCSEFWEFFFPLMKEAFPSLESIDIKLNLRKWWEVDRWSLMDTFIGDFKTEFEDQFPNMKQVKVERTDDK